MLKKTSTFITVQFTKEGIHCYPEAATNPNLATGGWDDVSFLASPHRHIFHFTVSIEVFHDDRDLEFIQVKRRIERWFDEGVLSAGRRSCEMLSDELAERIHQQWPGRKLTISVFEDGENGSTTTYEPSDDE